MRSGSKLLLICGALAGLVGSLGPSAPEAVASPGAAPAGSQSPQDALLAQRADLVSRLNAITGPRDQARNQLLAAERDLSATESSLNDSRAQLDSLDAALKSLQSHIDANEHSLATARVQLGGLLRATYESSDKDGFAGAILNSNSFGDAMDRIHSAQRVTDQVAQLQDQIAHGEADLLRERSDLQAKFAAAQRLEDVLNQENGLLLAQVAARDAAFQSVDGPARALASQIAAIDDQLASAGQIDYSAPCGNRFAFGNCTYYVATRRCIPWLGNAYEWWDAARNAGFAEGSTPQRGAVVVWGRGGSSPYGHVAYVEAVGPDSGVPAGSFLISEMNYNGWDRVNHRVIQDGAPGIIGFIYGHI